mmetsp:Transcript_39138/g.66625  ORF Transcript_39138/g.66625 Transcript_39138/m.66625 type:complete len:143 (+) Transcript_39138:3-431(+)
MGRARVVPPPEASATKTSTTQREAKVTAMPSDRQQRQQQQQQQQPDRYPRSLSPSAGIASSMGNSSSSNIVRSTGGINSSSNARSRDNHILSPPPGSLKAARVQEQELEQPQKQLVKNAVTIAATPSTATITEAPAAFFSDD